MPISRALPVGGGLGSPLMYYVLSGTVYTVYSITQYHTIYITYCMAQYHTFRMQQQQFSYNNGPQQ